MPLPKLSTPTYNLNIPSTGMSIEYRPFLVSEEKLLLMLKEGNDTQEIMTGIRKLIESCVIGEIDVDSLAPFDLEYIFINLRSKSIGEDIEVLIKCEECEKQRPLMINIEKDVKMVGDMEEKNRTIKINNEVGITMKVPTIKNASKFSKDKPIEVLIDSIESIYDGKTVHNVSEFDRAEVEEFVSSLSLKNIEDISAYFETLPTMSCEIDFTCENCEHQNTTTVKGFMDFF